MNFDKILELAQNAFWESIAESYPDIKSGDCSPEALIEFDIACTNVVIHWLENNSDIETPRTVQKPKNYIYIKWHTADVIETAINNGLGNITEAEAMQILEYIKRTHNAEYGVSWETIECAIEHYTESKKK